MVCTPYLPLPTKIGYGSTWLRTDLVSISSLSSPWAVSEDAIANYNFNQQWSGNNLVQGDKIRMITDCPKTPLRLL